MVDLLNDLLFVFQRLNWLSVVDLFLVTVVFYVLLMFLRNTQAMILLRGVFSLIILVSLLTVVVDLPAFSWLVTTTLPALLIAIPVIFAPEIRRALERLGRVSAFLPTGRVRAETQDVISVVAYAAARLSERRHGALIVLQRLDSLSEYVSTGISLDAHVTTQLILQIFYPNTPLHDGAVIISGTRLLGAACVMPLSASGVLAENPDRQMGLRHRAALGTSEVGDAVAVVVSEETGAVSVAYGGRMIHRLGEGRLEAVLRAFYRPLEPKNGIEEYLYRIFPFLSPDAPEPAPELEQEEA
ncbi:MAG: diadenylate cyclase CdaA [Anaerolineae bacterium]|nr:diadenylate cyclase CdaA [Anaerolineae bacterium]